MRGLLWIIAFLIGVVGVVMPGVYFYYSTKLPPLESEFDLEKLLRGYIEGERTSQRVGSEDLRKLSSVWPRPDFQGLPRDLVALYISSQGCPSFFQTPREGTTKAGMRAFRNYLLHQGTDGVNGRCELKMGSHLTNGIRIYGDWEQGIAALRIRNFLSKDQLVAYDLTSINFEDGVFGVEDASRVLFAKPLAQLTLAQQAELMLALLPESFYSDLKVCRAPIVLKQWRDALLEKLARDALVPPDRAKRAEEDVLGCTRG